MHKFNYVDEWSERSQLVVGIDSRGIIVDAQMNSADLVPESMEAKFNQACKDSQQYQISLPDLHIMTSVDPCPYSSHGGPNETFVLTSVNGK